MGDRNKQSPFNATNLTVGAGVATAIGAALWYMFSDDNKEQQQEEPHGHAQQTPPTRRAPVRQPEYQPRRNGPAESRLGTQAESRLGPQAESRRGPQAEYTRPQENTREFTTMRATTSATPNVSTRTETRTPAATENIPQNTVSSGRDGIEVCAICTDDLFTSEDGSMPVELPCNHYYHMRCIMQWLREERICPECMHVLPANLKGLML